MGKFLTGLLQDYKVFGPVKKKDFHVFSEINDVSELDLGFLNTRFSAKKILLPNKDVIFKYENTKIVKELDNLIKENKELKDKLELMYSFTDIEGMELGYLTVSKHHFGITYIIEEHTIGYIRLKNGTVVKYSLEGMLKK